MDFLDAQIDEAASSIGTQQELSEELRDCVINYVESGFLGSIDDYELKRLIRASQPQKKFAIRVTLKVIGRKEPDIL